MDRDLQEELFGSDSEGEEGEMQTRVRDAARLLRGVWDATVRIEARRKGYVEKAQTELDKVTRLQEQLPPKLEAAHKERDEAERLEEEAEWAYKRAKMRSRKATEDVRKLESNKDLYARAEVDSSNLVERETQDLMAQRRYVKAAHKLYSEYMDDVNKWKRDGFANPSGRVVMKRVWVAETPSAGRWRELPTPWLAPSPQGSPNYERDWTGQDTSSDDEQDTEPLSVRLKRNRSRSDDNVVAQEEEEDVVVMGESSWAQRDAALRQKAIALDASVVDDVFRKLGVAQLEETPTDALFGIADKFQPINLTFDHTKRTTFDEGANVRARVRFRMEGKYPVAWLDDLHSLHYHMRGKGDQQSLWQLPGGAPYATDTSMHEYVGGIKIWRVEDDTFRIKFYGPRSRLPFGGEPEVYAVYAEVPFSSATKWDPNAWKLLGAKRHFVTFKDHVKNLFPMILATLLNTSAGLPGMTAEDARVRAWWAKKPTYPVMVYKQ